MSIAGFRVTALQITGLPGKVGGPFRPGWVIPLYFSLPFVGLGDNPFECRDTLPSCQVQDQGIQLVVTVLDGSGNPIDISAASDTVIKLLYPDGTTVDFNASFFTDGTDGKLIYNTAADDLDQAGLYEVQAKVNMASAPKSTQRGKMWVYANINDN